MEKATHEELIKHNELYSQLHLKRQLDNEN